VRPDPLAVVPVLDAARGYALIMVIVYHCWIAEVSPQLDGGPAARPRRVLLSSPSTCSS